jgi:hypothetical protein
MIGSTVNYKRMTAICTVMCIVFLIVIDIGAALVPVVCNTISCNVLEWSQSFPPLTFAMGFLCGHLLWPQKMMQVNGKWVYKD